LSDLVRWNPYDELARIRDEFNQAFAPFWTGRPWSGQMNRWIPSVDVKESAERIELSAEIPGVNPEDVDVTVSDDSVVIRGEVKQETMDNDLGYQRQERRYGSFQRTIPLPAAVKHEQTAIAYYNGILTLTMPKAEPGKTRSTRLKIGEGPHRLQ
jgi:HSP20 family protein